ncbi:hypothetical protein [Amycolatopsis thermoflava]|uniref:hypothetical protein n=1 Tax=Amycolatopsis thermoflava TaxID=84480 RepID=UPI003F4A4089
MTAALDLSGRHAECRSCKASVVWAVSSKSGDRIPVDYSPNAAKGNVLLQLDRDRLVAGVLSGAQLTGARARGADLRTAHFATCPNADAHRRAR